MTTETDLRKRLTEIAAAFEQDAVESEDAGRYLEADALRYCAGKVRDVMRETENRAGESPA